MTDQEALDARAGFVLLTHHLSRAAVLTVHYDVITGHHWVRVFYLDGGAHMQRGASVSLDAEWYTFAEVST